MVTPRVSPNTRLLATVAKTIEPAGKASFVSRCMQTRLIVQNSGKGPISLVYVSKPLITAITGSEINQSATTGSPTLSFLRSFSISSLSGGEKRSRDEFR